MGCSNSRDIETDSEDDSYESDSSSNHSKGSKHSGEQKEGTTTEQKEHKKKHHKKKHKKKKHKKRKEVLVAPVYGYPAALEPHPIGVPVFGAPRAQFVHTGMGGMVAQQSIGGMTQTAIL